MGGNPPHWEKPGGFPPSGLQADHGEETSVTIQCNLSVPRAGGGDTGGGVGGTLNVNL